ncbi:hypothetical protein B4U37_11935 [Sutcliffiella horikoshii]|uniref:Uncharacterized protein n=1 Tax=Sutcliffiella horikoshii TaxID=79883 RepID=A0A1Y0CP60_9BACI|nr:hypothetical protein [Sutcliffiella horikoshii]ART76707.1 hypothetical protein B4U37_11935 [Sutcliffiella horikoshii]TYS58066.1 hypothetical protein FZC74_13810 [Sutcliffiella horikoshii]
MVTFFTILLFISMMLFTTILDCYYYESNILDCFTHLFIFDPGLREWMVYLTFIFGILVAVIQDVRFKNNKGRGKGANGK